MDLSNHHRKWILSGNNDDIPRLELYEGDTIIIHENKNVNLWYDFFLKTIFRTSRLVHVCLGL